VGSKVQRTTVVIKKLQLAAAGDIKLTGILYLSWALKSLTTVIDWH
jgi:hypothetical protein